MRGLNALGGHKLVGLIQDQWDPFCDPATPIRIGARTLQYHVFERKSVGCIMLRRSLLTGESGIIRYHVIIPLRVSCSHATPSLTARRKCGLWLCWTADGCLGTHRTPRRWNKCFYISCWQRPARRTCKTQRRVRMVSFCFMSTVVPVLGVQKTT